MPDPAPCNFLQSASWFSGVKLYFGFSFQGAVWHLPRASRPGEEGRTEGGPGCATVQCVWAAGFWGCVRRKGDITC